MNSYTNSPCRYGERQALVNRRNEILDYIRGLACLLVMLYHYTSRYDQLFGHKAPCVSISSGGYAVSAFFIISGLLGNNEVKRTYETPMRYIGKKAARLYPSYLVSVFITYIITTLYLPERAVNFSTAMMNLTMLQGFVGIENVDGAYWTLQYEIVFYVWTAVAIAFKQKRYSNTFLISYMSGLIIKETVQTFLGFSPNRIFTLVDLILMSGYGHMFATGIVIGNIARKERIPTSVIVLIMCVAYQYLVHPLNYSIIYTVFLALVMMSQILYESGFSLKKPLIILLKPLAFIAKLSFPLYLIHQNVGYAIIKSLENKHNTFNTLAVTMTTVVAVSYVMNRFIENPCITFYARLTNGFGNAYTRNGEQK